MAELLAELTPGLWVLGAGVVVLLLLAFVVRAPIRRITRALASLQKETDRRVGVLRGLLNARRRDGEG